MTIGPSGIRNSESIAIMIEMLAFLYCVDPLIEQRETSLYQEHIQVVSEVDQSDKDCFIITIEPLKNSKK
jgi:hypothetical protein